jgi:glycosyltransferase 2 family protein
MPAATFLGIWILIDQLAGFDNIADILKSAQWLWVLVVLILTQITNVTEAISLSGAVQAAIPLGPLTLLRSATDFSGLVGGTAGRTTTIVRFYQRRGMSPTVAISSGVLYSLGGFAMQVVLAGIALLFAAGEFSTTTAGQSGSDSEILLTVLLVIVAAAFVGAIAFVIPRIRRLVSARIRPEMQAAWSNLRAIIADPAKLSRLLGGQVLTQCLGALALMAALRSVGGSASFASLIVLCTAASFFGGVSPVPGGMGVMEATYISGLTLLGIPEDIAVGATLLYRLCTTYLPPIWGWLSLMWLRRHEML